MEVQSVSSTCIFFISPSHDLSTRLSSSSSSSSSRQSRSPSSTSVLLLRVDPSMRVAQIFLSATHQPLNTSGFEIPSFAILPVFAPRQSSRKFRPVADTPDDRRLGRARSNPGTYPNSSNAIHSSPILPFIRFVLKLSLQPCPHHLFSTPRIPRTAVS